MITGSIHAIANRMTKALSQLGVPIPYEKVLAALQLSEFPVSPDQTPDPPGWRKSMEGIAWEDSCAGDKKAVHVTVKGKDRKERRARYLGDKAALRAAQETGE